MLLKFVGRITTHIIKKCGEIIGENGCENFEDFLVKKIGGSFEFNW